MKCINDEILNRKLKTSLSKMLIGTYLLINTCFQ